MNRSMRPVWKLVDESVSLGHGNWVVNIPQAYKRSSPTSFWFQNSPSSIRACLHGGGGPQIGEVTR